MSSKVCSQRSTASLSSKATKTDHSADGSSSSTTEPQCWGANVFRLVKHRWEKLEIVDGSSSSSSSSIENHGLMVSPRKNRIVIPGIRQMFSLSEQQSTGKDAFRHRSFVVQRDNRILLIPSKQRSRAILLVFASIQDCREFSDCFVRLNPTSTPTSTSHGQQPQQPQSVEFVDESRLEQDQLRLFSYITRLLHDDDFLQFVHRLETLISSTKDGGEMLNHLAASPLVIQQEAGVVNDDHGSPAQGHVILDQNEGQVPSQSIDNGDDHSPSSQMGDGGSGKEEES